MVVRKGMERLGWLAWFPFLTHQLGLGLTSLGVFPDVCPPQSGLGALLSGSWCLPLCFALLVLNHNCTDGFLFYPLEFEL